MSINLQQDIKPISHIKTHAADMMKYVTEQKNPILITQHGEAKAVLMDIASYQTMQDAFDLLRIINLSEKQVAAGECEVANDVFSNIEAKLAAHKLGTQSE